MTASRERVNSRTSGVSLMCVYRRGERAGARSRASVCASASGEDRSRSERTHGQLFAALLPPPRSLTTHALTCARLRAARAVSDFKVAISLTIYYCAGALFQEHFGDRRWDGLLNYFIVVANGYGR